MPNHPITNSPTHPLADKLEFHEESYNAESARRIGGELWERGDALVIYSKPEMGSGLNFACRIRSTDAGIENLLDQVTEWFTGRGVMPHIRVSPLTRPSNVARILESRGYICTERETQMVLEGADTEPPSNPRVVIEPIDTEKLHLWAGIQHRGFGGIGAPSPEWLEMARTAIHTPGNTLYLAHLEGTPVGAGVLADWAGVHGIYGVATLPEGRGQGVGTAVVRRMVQDAHAHDHAAPLCLQAETASGTQHWYERLGFRVVYDRTGWTLEDQTRGTSIT